MYVKAFCNLWGENLQRYCYVAVAFVTIIAHQETWMKVAGESRSSPQVLLADFVMLILLNRHVNNFT